MISVDATRVQRWRCSRRGCEAESALFGTYCLEARVIFSVWVAVCSPSRVPRRELRMDPHSPAPQHRSVLRAAFISVCPLGFILEFLPYHSIATRNSYRREIGIQLGRDGSRS
jgi:hypothetical protein